MRLPKRAHDAMLERIAAYWQSQLVFVAAKLGIADVLVEGPLTVDEIAEELGASSTAIRIRLFRARRAARAQVESRATSRRSDLMKATAAMAA